MRWRTGLAAVVALPALALGVSLTTAPAGTSASAFGPGSFAFTQTSDRGFSYHVILTDTAGGSRRLLTTKRAVGRPAFSPTGRQVAFAGPLTDDSDGRYGIYVVNTDGSGLRQLSAPRFADLDPAWSPDGRSIAFSRNVNGNGRLSCCAIGLMNADGSSQRLVPGTTYGVQPTWSANSRRLGYTAYDGLHAVSTDGSAPAVLVRGSVSWPAWSPDGHRIAYVRGIRTGYSQVQLVPAAGGTPVAVESVSAQAESPTWAPDSYTLYYVLFHGYGDEGRTDAAVWRSTAPGTTPTRLFAYGVGIVANVYGLSFTGPPHATPAKPSAVSWAAGRLDVFYRSIDNSLGHSWGNGSAFGRESLGGVIAGNPGAVSWGSGRLDVFARGTNRMLYHRFYAGAGWPAYENLGAAIGGDPVAVSWAPGRIDVFYGGSGGALGHSWYAGGWHSELLGGVLGGDPTAVTWGPGRLDVFYRGVDRSLRHAFYNGAGWFFEGLGGVLAGEPSATSRGRGRIDVALRGSTNGLYVNSYDAGWSGYRSLGGRLGGDPDATAISGGRVDVTAPGSPPDLPLLHTWADSTGWHPFEALAGPVGGQPETVSWGPGRLDVFYRGLDATLRHRPYAAMTWGELDDLGGALAP